MKVLVVGLARSGVAACRVLRQLGSIVKATDIKPAEALGSIPEKLDELGVAMQLGEHGVEFASDCDLIVVSPGVPLDIPLLKWAEGSGIPIIGEVELAWCLSDARFIAVTGTNGKSTTVSLIGDILRLSTPKVRVGGNIGNPISAIAAGLGRDWIVVAEVSSFQLDTCITFRPTVSVLLNITPDHLDRYASFDAYFQSKARIFANQTQGDIAIVNLDDPRCTEAAHGAKCSNLFFSTTREAEEGAFIKDDTVVVRVADIEREIFSIRDLRIRGPHNLANSLAATLATIVLDTEASLVRKAIREFRGLEHRMEFVCEIDGVEFINDSKATNPEAVRFAIEGTDRPVVLIAGGKDKGSDFSILIEPIRANVKAAVLIGEARAKMRQVLEGECKIYEARDMVEAVRKAYDLARPFGTVLLSPACASFDMFDDFEHRGKVFKQAVEGLKR